jgi:hypothetical protein
MPTTANKGYEVQATGSNTNTWGDVTNDAMISIVDENLGGITTKTLSNSPVVLSATESQTLTVRLNGTLTGAVLVTTACIGMTIVENVTSGAFAVTFGNGVGTPVTIPQGTRAVVITDGTNGPRVAADTVVEFASGTRMLFHQTAAPTGWTKETTLNNRALRLVSGTVGSGGSLNFTAAFAANRTPSGVVGNTAITEAQMPLHGHPYLYSFGSSGTGEGGILSRSVNMGVAPAYTGAPSTSDTDNLHKIGGTGGSQAHGHTLTMDALPMDVLYTDVIIAQKA